MDVRVNFKLGLCLLLISSLLTATSLRADDDVDDNITDIIEKEKEKAEEEAEERAEEEAERLFESLLEKRFGDNSDIDNNVEDELESWLEEQLEANTTGDDLEERMDQELEKHLETLADDDSQSEEQLQFVDDKLQQLWQFEDDLEESLLPPLPNQMIALVTAEELAAAKASGAVTLKEESLSEFGMILVTFDDSQPIPIDTEPNHVYQLDALNTANQPANGLTQAKLMDIEHTLIAKQRIGLMDSSINTQHVCFTGLAINQQRFHDKAQPSFKHGTAMASILLGENACDAQGILRQAQLFNAVVFAQNKAGIVIASASQLVAGLSWLLTQKVNIINMSLSGPPNRILEQALKQVAARGITLVASAGNDGRAAFPRFPAAYPEVIAVTAVDQQLKIFDRAAQGPHIEISAPGVDMLIAQGTTYASLSGTSLAAAMVTAVLASDEVTLIRPDLSSRAQILGKEVRDPMFGFGLLQNK
ncbi:MAG: minor extracellular protease Epr [Oleispira sp.]|jgi:minor extracellular protease Epr